MEPVHAQLTINDISLEYVEGTLKENILPNVSNQICICIYMEEK